MFTNGMHETLVIQSVAEIVGFHFAYDIAFTFQPHVLKLESFIFVLVGHDAVRLCTAQRRAVPCRAITRPIQNNNYLTA